jgi:hypothetical protein
LKTLPQGETDVGANIHTLRSTSDLKALTGDDSSPIQFINIDDITQSHANMPAKVHQ